MAKPNGQCFFLPYLLFGKWDLGSAKWLGKREPTNQGFDEWYGIPYTSHTSQFTSMEGFPEGQEPPYIWEGLAGETSTIVKPFNLDTRRVIDREAAEKSVDFIRENTTANKPFFLYYPMTQPHFPALPHPDKAGTTGAGDMGDAMADVDHNVGLILDELKKLGIEENTIVIWCSDNGAELRRPWRGNPGPYRGYYNSAMEGGIRTPCVIRWPNRIKSGQVSNEIVHLVDLFPTIAAAVGSPYVVMADRIIDGIDQLSFLSGNQKKSNRESTIVLHPSGTVMAVKWHNWKLWYHFQTELPDGDPDNLIRLFDLGVDPQEEVDVKDFYPWVIGIMDSIVNDYETSLVKHPRVSAKANADDPYLPPPMGSGKLVPSYSRTDRGITESKSVALPNPDFSGSWSTTVLHLRSAIGRVDKPQIATLGSGWGENISISHHPDKLEVERVFFVSREAQPLIKYQYALDESTTENKLYIGRDSKPPVSNTKWEDDKLVITTLFPCQDPRTGTWQSSKMIQTLWLEEPKTTPWEATLIVETHRESVLGGLPSTNRTIYTKGYR